MTITFIYETCEYLFPWRNHPYVMRRNANPLPRFHVPFWLSHILVYLFYFCPSFCPS